MYSLSMALCERLERGLTWLEIKKSVSCHLSPIVRCLNVQPRPGIPLANQRT